MFAAAVPDKLVGAPGTVLSVVVVGANVTKAAKNAPLLKAISSDASAFPVKS